MAVAVAIGLLFVIVAIHELGHFVASLLVRIQVQSFSLGLPFGPRLGFPVGKYRFQITLLPLGAATNMAEGVLENAPLWKQILVYLAGPLANLTSVFVLSVFFFGLGSGVTVGTLIVSTEAATLIATGTEFVPLQEISGPVGIVAFCIRLIQADLVQGLQFSFLLVSGAIGLSNLLPIPALDGGEIIMNGLVRLGIFSRSRATMISNISVGILVALTILLVVKDVGRLIQ